MSIFRVKDNNGIIYNSISEYCEKTNVSEIEALQLIQKKELIKVRRRRKNIIKREYKDVVFKLDKFSKEFKHPYHIEPDLFSDALNGKKVEIFLENRNQRQINRIKQFKKDIGKIPFKIKGHRQQLISFDYLQMKKSKILIILNP